MTESPTPPRQRELPRWAKPVELVLRWVLGVVGVVLACASWYIAVTWIAGVARVMFLD